MSQGSKRFKKRWLIFLVLVAGVGIFHKPLVLLGCKLVLKNAIPKGRVVSYDAMRWEEGAIAISGLKVIDPISALTVDRIEVRIKGDFFHFKPHITVIHPQIVYSTVDKSPPMLPFLYRTKLIQPRWDISGGMMQLASGARYYFTLVPSNEVEGIGTFAISNDASPMLSVELAMRDGLYQAGIKLGQSELSRVLPLSALFMQGIQGWEKADGQLELEGLFCFNPDFEMQEVHCLGSGKQLDLKGSGIDLVCEELQGGFSYPVEGSTGSFWDKLSATFHLNSGFCHLEQRGLGISYLNGDLTFAPKEEPKVALSGTLIQEARQIPFTLTGKGGVLEDRTFWSELDFTSRSMQMTLSICSTEHDALTLHLNVEAVAAESLDFLRGFVALPGTCIDGIAQGQATFVYREGECQTASIEHLQLDNISWDFPEQKRVVYATQILAKSGLVKKNGVWALEDLQLVLQEGDYLDSRLHVNHLSSEIALERGILQTSQIRGQWGDLQAEAVVLANELHVKLQGDGKALFNLWSKPSAQALEIDCQIDAKLDKGDLHVDIAGAIEQEPIQASGLFTCNTLVISELLLGNFPTIQFKEGQFLAENLSEKSYGPFVSVFSPDANLSGQLHCKAQVTPARIQLQLGGEGIVITHPLVQLSLPQLKQKTAQFVYDKTWHGEIPLIEAKLHYSELGLDVSAIEGTLKLDGDRLKITPFYAECEGLGVRGNLEASLSQGQLNLATSQIAGDMKSLVALLNHFPSVPHISVPVEGDFSSSEKGFVLNNGEWSFKGSFNHLHFPVNAGTTIAEGRCEIQFDSKIKRFSLDKGEGVWQLRDGSLCTVAVKRLSMDAAALEFDCNVADGKREFAHFAGKATQNPQKQWQIAFEPGTHFAGTKLNVTQCVLNEVLKPIAFEMRPVLKCQELHHQAAFLQNAGFLPPSFSPKNLQEWQMEGSLQARVTSEDLQIGFNFLAESRDFKIKGKTCDSFHLSGQKIGEKWLIEKLEAGKLSLKGAFLVDNQGVSVPQFEGKWQGIALKGSGFVKPDQKRFTCTFESVKGELAALELKQAKGTFAAGVSLTGDYSSDVKITGEVNLFLELQTPLALIAANRKAIKFTYAQSTGLQLEGLDVQLKHRISNQHLADLKAAKLVKSDNLTAHQLQFSLTPALIGHAIDAKMVSPLFKEFEWEGNLEGLGDLVFSSKGTTFQGSLKAGRYSYKGKSLNFDQLQIHIEKETVMVRAKTKIEDQPLWTTLQVDFAKEPFGVLKLFDHPKADGLKLLFITQNGKLNWESVQGSCYGLSCQLTKNSKRKIPAASTLSGQIKVNGSKLSALLPEDMRQKFENFKIGGGYEWHGDLVLWQEGPRSFQANGALRGAEFEVFGYRLHNLEASLEATSDRIVISNLQIDDPSGTIAIKKIEIQKQEDWELSIPYITVRQMQPSLMRKTSGVELEIKPFTIKNFVMKDIHGKLGDKATLEGSAHLSFANQFKKESSILDTPIEMIKNIGLDPGILTPVQGELEMELRGDKFYLVNLQNSFSEGNRAEFYLSPNKDLSYIDLDGKMHINLNMRQDVVLKITEAFTLTIRGTLDKPRYGLQF